MIFNELEEFKKEFKKLSKLYNSLVDDFADFKFLLETSPTGDILPEKHIVRISGLGEDVVGEFFKVRRFFCKSLQSNGDIRIIYKYSYEIDMIEFCEIEFIEIFKKCSKKQNHDIKRMKKHYSK